MRYTYGTGETALKRLETVAQIFNPHSATFIRKQAAGKATCAVDLGCGPGFSTVMLAKAARARRTCGFDNADEFLSSARDSCDSCDFLKHDVTDLPFPVKADIMYCRFLLSHLPCPSGLIESWLGELAPGGLLLVEEVEDIETDLEVFQRYLEVNRGLVASQNAQLYVGGELSRARYSHPPLVNDSVTLPVNSAQAAAMFYPNTISIWEDEEYVLQSLSSAERKEISARLLELARTDDDQTGIVWKMRRMVILKAC